MSPTFVICVGEFHRNFMISWFHDLSPFVSTTFPAGSFGESRRNRIWTYTVSAHTNLGISYRPDGLRNIANVFWISSYW